MRTYSIAVCPGDGIGVEVTREAVKALKAVQDLASGFRLTLKEFDWGSAFWQRTGKVVPDDYLDVLRGFDAMFLGALGDPERIPDYDTLAPIIQIRQSFDEYVCLRPAKLLPGIASPLARRGPGDVDLVIVRENSEGEYADVGGQLKRGRPQEVVAQTAVHTRKGVERILRYAFQLSEKRKKRLAMATKSNAQKYGMVLWDEALAAISREFPEVEAEKYHVDALAMNLVRSPEAFDVVVASNLFGDILSDLAGVISGSLGVAPSANINPERTYPSFFEPVHGSAPDIAGKGIANPIGAIRSAAMMLDFLGEPEAAAQIEEAIAANLAAGKIRTPDLGGSASSEQVGTDIAGRIHEGRQGVSGSLGAAEGPGERAAGSPPGFRVLERYLAIDNVCAWPNLTMLGDGTIIATIFNQPAHGEAEGDVECWASLDGGRTWELRGTAAQHDEPNTNRMNVAVGLAHNGDLVVLTSGWALDASRKLVRQLSPWVCRSSDGGRTWSVDKSRSAVVFPEGADYEDRDDRMIKPFGDIVALPSGELAASLYHDYGTVWVLFSRDDGRTWGDAVVLSDECRGETAMLRLRPDRWLAASRTERGPDGVVPRRGLELFVSEDEGRTWTAKGPLTGPPEKPAHLLDLRDGRVLLTYGIRGMHGVYGVGFRVSDDEGRTWNPPEVLVRLETEGFDLGYPSTVELADGVLVTAYYAKQVAEHSRYHMGVVRWEV